MLATQSGKTSASADGTEGNRITEQAVVGDAEQFEAAAGTEAPYLARRADPRLAGYASPTSTG